MTRAFAAILALTLSVEPARAQQGEPVFEIRGEVVDESGQPIPYVEVTVVQCSTVSSDARGKFAASCVDAQKNARVRAGDAVVIKARKAGWVTAFGDAPTGAVKGGDLPAPIRMRRIAAPVAQRPQRDGPVAARPQVGVTLDASDAGQETTLTVVVRNLFPQRILLDDLIVHVEQVFEIRHAVGRLNPSAVPEGGGALVLRSTAAEAYDVRTHLGRPLEGKDESRPPLTFRLLDDSPAADHDALYLVRVEVTWDRAPGHNPPSAVAESPSLFLIRGRRNTIDLRSATQQNASAAFDWNHQQIERLSKLKARRTAAVDTLVASLSAFTPKDVRPGVTLDGAVTANADTVHALVLADQGKNRNAKAELIYKAAQSKNWEVVSELADEGTYPDQFTVEFAAKAGQTALVSKLLTKGGAASAALHAAAEAGHLDIVQLAFDRGANTKDVTLCSAIVGRNVDIFRAFLAKGAKNFMADCQKSVSPTEPSPFPRDGSAFASPIALAARADQEDMLRALVESEEGPEGTVKATLGFIVRDAILEGVKEHNNVKDVRPAVRLLLKFGADVRNADGRMLGSDAEIAKMLVGAGAEINQNPSYDITSELRAVGIIPASGATFDRANGSSLLYAATRFPCDLDLVNTLRVLGARRVPFRHLSNIGLNDRLQRDLIDYLDSKEPRLFASLQCLILAGDDVRTLTGYYEPAIVSAALSGDLQLLRLLLDNGADPNFTKGDESALAAVFDRSRGPKSVSVDAVRMLLEKGANPNVTLFEKNLVVLAFEQFPVPIEAVRLLVAAQKGVLELSKWDLFGASPLDKCAHYNDVECVRYLLMALPAPKVRDAVKQVMKSPPNNEEILTLFRNALNTPRKQ